MKSFKKLTALSIPLPLKNIDTDLIIPAVFLTSISREGYGQNLFRRLRDQNPDFPLNKNKFKDGQILIAGSNFGCGSSREHAVWALLDYGIKVIIAASFADIFFSNAAKNGLVLIQLDETIVNDLLNQAATGDFKLTINLATQTVSTNKNIYHFPFDAFRKECILKGLDDLDYILDHQKAINDYNQKQQPNRFYSTLKANY